MVVVIIVVVGVRLFYKKDLVEEWLQRERRKRTDSMDTILGVSVVGALQPVAWNIRRE